MSEQNTVVKLLIEEMGRIEERSQTLEALGREMARITQEVEQLAKDIEDHVKKVQNLS